MDSSHAHQGPHEPRVLYGRVAVYVASLLLAFVLGTIIGGRGQASDAELAAYQAEVSELRRDNYGLEQQVAAYAAGQALPPGAPPGSADAGAADGAAAGGGVAGGETGGQEVAVDGADPAEDAGSEPAAPLPPGASTYEVQAGDTLTSIAKAVYGDGSKYELIAAANGVDAQLEIGQQLVIPAEPDVEEESATAPEAETAPE